MIEVQDNKFVVWKNDSMDKGDVRRAYEDDRQYKINIFQTILGLIFDKRFRYGVESCVNYAFTHSDCYRGSYSSDVILFSHNKQFHKGFILTKGGYNV